jgi:L-lactate dehydrogenase complex protein LldG
MGTRALIEGLRANSCTVHEFSAGEVAERVLGRVEALAGGGPVAIATGDPVLAALGVVDALRAASLDLLEPGAEDWATRLADATVGVTGAAIGVGDPPTLGLGCGPEMPRAVSLLPRTHVCVVHSTAVVPTLADAIARVAAAPLPSAWTWIGGPSRTGDLEMVQTLGVHGPVAVEVVVVTGA